MAWFQAVQRPQEERRRQENPGVKASLLDELIEIVHIRNMPPYPITAKEELFN